MEAPEKAWAERHKELLNLELRAEEQEYALATTQHKHLESAGIGIHRLRVASSHTALFGRPSLTLTLQGARPMPVTKISTGTLVRLRSEVAASSAAAATTGTVVQLSNSAVVVSFDELDEDALREPLSLVMAPNDVTYRRMNVALDALSSGTAPAASAPLVRGLFSAAGPRTPSAAVAPLAKVFNSALNAGQRDAVAFALATRPCAVIHGPPGTGKTTAVVELIRQAVSRGERVLAVAASNVAVDNLVERLASGPTPPALLRIGHPARLLPSVVSHSLDAQMRHSSSAAIVDDVKCELAAATNTAKSTRGKSRRAACAEIRELRREIGRRHAGAVREILLRSRVVLCTTTGANDRALATLPPEHTFDLVVIDEAAQALEASCWIALLRGKRAVLAGDHLQLPPVVKSSSADEGGLSVTLMERLLQQQPDVGWMLTTQYRMHADICRWASDELYDGRLTPDASVESHTLSSLPGVAVSEATSAALVFIDTAGCDCEEDSEEAFADAMGAGARRSMLIASSRSNKAEAQVVAHYVQELRDAGVSDDAIGVITPYNAQVELLRGLLRAEARDDEEMQRDALKGIDVSTVDGFQGREKEAIIISLVRSNPERNVGFLSEQRRMNVAVTRARRHVALIGDSATVESDPFLKRLVEYMCDHGDVRTAHSYGAVPAGASRVSSAGAEPSPAIGAAAESRKTAEAHAEMTRRIREFAADPSSRKLRLPASLSARDRALAHQLAGELGLDHSSSGVGNNRRLTIRKAATPSAVTDVAHKSGASAVDSSAQSLSAAATKDGSVPTAHADAEETGTEGPTPDGAQGYGGEAKGTPMQSRDDLAESARAAFQGKVQSYYERKVREGLPPNEAASAAMTQALAEARAEEKGAAAPYGGAAAVSERVERTREAARPKRHRRKQGKAATNRNGDAAPEADNDDDNTNSLLHRLAAGEDPMVASEPRPDDRGAPLPWTHEALRAEQKEALRARLHDKMALARHLREGGKKR